MRLPEFSLRRPVTVLVTSLAIVVLGLVSFPRLKLDFLPKMDFPFVGVQIPYANSVPSQVEKEIARPVEEVMATLGGLRELESYSDQGGCFVAMQFDFEKNIDVLRMDVREKMEQVRALLPDDVKDYYVFTFNSSDIPIMVGRISAPGRDLSGEYDLLERRIINPIRRIDGVGQMGVDGVAPKSITIYLELDKVVEHGVNVERLFELLTANNVDMSLGKAHHGGQRISVRSLGQFRSIDDVKNLVIHPSGIKLDDVSDVVFSEPAPEYYRRLNGEPAIAFHIQKASGANIVEVSRQVNQLLGEIDKDPDLTGIDVVLFFDQAKQIRNSLTGLLQSGLIGSVLAIGILFFFLRKIGPTMIVAVAIPFSVISTLVFLYLTDRTLNILSMMGLMLAVGMLVDNAIVVLESIYRRKEKGEPARTASAHGAREVAMAVIASTLTSVIVFAPIILSKGSELSIYLSEVGVTISVTLILSLAVCLTIVPLFASRIRGGGASVNSHFLTRARDRYLKILNWTAVQHPLRVGALFVPAAIVLTVLAVKISGFGMDESGDRGVKQDNLYFRLDFVDNTNIYGVRDYVDEIEQWLLPRTDSLGVESLYTFYVDNFATFGLFFEDPDHWGEEEILELRKYLREELPVIAGIEYMFGDEEGGGRGAKDVSVTLFGEDSDHLATIGEEVERRFRLIDGLEDVRSDQSAGADEVRIRLDRSQSARFGIQSQTLAQVLGLTFRGVRVGEFQGENREIELGVVLEPSDRRNIDNLERLPLTYREGRPVVLGQVANFDFGKGPSRINRESQKTALTIRGSYEGDDSENINSEVAGVMRSLDLPAGYSWSFGRELIRAREQRDQLGINALLALACVYFVMAALFESFLHPLVIMFCIPFAGLGVIWTFLITNTPFNLMAMIGSVILIGIVVNNGIVLLDHIDSLRRRGLSREQAILSGCRDRFRPILMTASTTILGLVPLAFGKTTVGDGYYYPLARAVMGGLAVSTVLTLIVLPTFYVLAERAAAYMGQVLGWGRGKNKLPWRSAAPTEGS